MTAQPLDWIKQVSPAILEQDEASLFGKAPSFPWAKLSEEVSRILQTQTFQIKPQNYQWRDPENIKEGYSGNISILTFGISPLEGTLSWLIPEEDLETLMLALFTQPPQHFEAIDPDFKKGFYHFLAAQVVQIISKLDFDKNLSPSLINETFPDFQSPCFCIDLAMQLTNRDLNGRIVLSADLCRSWRQRFAEKKLGIDYNSPLAQKLQATVHLEAGKTELSQEEWNSVSEGDFIILDFCSFEPDSDKGRIMLTVEGIPLFRARLKQGSIKILEFPLYHEAETSMNNKNDEDEEEFEESEIEETEDEDFDDEEEEEDEEEEDDEFEDFTEESEVELKKEKSPPQKSEQAQPAAPRPQAEKKEVVKPEELSLTIVVEVGRIKMSVQKLMELQPGNVLDLNIYPENGVDLVVNGRCVGKGELLKVGETLGVRILDIG